MEFSRKSTCYFSIPGYRETYAARKLRKAGFVVQDSDSSLFSWEYDSNGYKLQERNVNFPQNYIDYIKANMQIASIIFVFSHDTVRKLMKEEGIPYKVVIPSLDMKEEIRQRMKDRLDVPSFIDPQMEHYEEWITTIMEEENEDDLIILSDGQYIFDIDVNGTKLSNLALLSGSL